MSSTAKSSVLMQALFVVALGVMAHAAYAQQSATTRLVRVGDGWARSSVNAVVFRGSSIVTHGATQYVAYYDSTGHMVLGKRRLADTQWELVRTEHRGEVRDAHNSISIGVDGHGVLHVAWDAHGTPLRYAHAVSPGSLVLDAPRGMTGVRERRVTYPQFHQLADGDLLFLYRDGESGRGDVMLNRWQVSRSQWSVVAHPLISGEGERNPYVNQLAIDARGGLHISWCWRETPDVATNHDVLYARSTNGGASWSTSTGRELRLPITAETAEVAWAVGQGQELINQTTMTVDERQRPIIATYWRAPDHDVPQFRLVWHDGLRWRMNQVGERTRPFRLGGGGTKRIPISRPLVVAAAGSVHVVFRDEERGRGIVVATSTDPARERWRLATIHDGDVGMWEPSHDPVLWQRDRRLHLFVQRVGQGDAETLEDVPAQPVSILEWRAR